MAKMPVPVPALRRQNEIANSLKTWRLRSRKLHDEIDVERARLAALPGALLRRAFSGEL
jgi:hypothetical protein